MSATSIHTGLRPDGGLPIAGLAVAASPRASPPPVISSALSLNIRHLPAPSGGGLRSPLHPAPVDAGPVRRVLQRETRLAPAGDSGMPMATEDDPSGAVAASLRASPPPGISSALSLNSRLQLIAASGGGPFIPDVGVRSAFHPPGGGCYGNVPSSSIFSTQATSLPRFVPLEAGPAGGALERETCPAPAGAAGAERSGMPVDRRKMRMMKNLESATRSRARKKAHVALIETEVMQLREANQQLRLQYDQLLKAKAEVSVSVKKTLQRVLSAPF